MLHYNEAGDETKSESSYTNGLIRYQFSNMVNCGVYLYTVSEMYKEDIYKEYGEKYASLLVISKDDH